MSQKTISKTHVRSLLDIRDKYRAAGKEWPAQSRDIARWAIDQGLWEVPPELALKKCTREMSEALKSERHTDAQGRQGVRTNVAARIGHPDEEGEIKQAVLWDDLRTASEDHLLASFRQQRKQAIGDCKSVQLQVDSANDNNPHLTDRPIKMVWDLTEEIEEAMQNDESVWDLTEEIEEAMQNDESVDPQRPR